MTNNAENLRDAAHIIERDDMVASEAAHWLRKLANEWDGGLSTEVNPRESDAVGDEFKPVGSNVHGGGTG